MRHQGTVYIYKWVNPSMDGEFYYKTFETNYNNDLILVGQAEIDCEIIDDTRAQEIEMAEKELEEKTALFTAWKQEQIARIQSLKAIEHAVES